MLVVVGAVVSTVRVTAVPVPQAPPLAPRMFSVTLCPLLPGIPVLLHVLPDTVAATHVAPSVVYSQAVSALLKLVDRSNGLLTKLPNCVFAGVTAPAVGAPACGVALAVVPLDILPSVSTAHAR